MMAVVCAANSYSQTIEKKWTMSVGEPLTSPQVEWISLDADTLMDAVVTGYAPDGQMKIITFQNVGGKTLSKKASLLTGMKEGHVQLADWDGNNRFDLLIAGKTLVNTDALFIFENLGNFTFQKNSNKLLEHRGLFCVGDFNNDGRDDLITVTNEPAPRMRVFRNTAAGLTTVFETEGILISDVICHDFNQDNKTDFIVSGKKQSQPIVQYYVNKYDSLYEVFSLPEGLQGRLTTGDYNLDGRMDVYVVGANQTNANVIKLWKNNTDGFSLQRFVEAPGAREIFAGDLTSDGMIELLTTKKMNDDTLVVALDTLLQTTQLNAFAGITQRAGDFDRDGDLDLLQAIDSVQQTWLRYFQNGSPSNERPAVPFDAFAISAFDKTFIFWERPIDDHTARLALTYDVWLGTQQKNILTPSFSLDHARRLVVAHGNAGSKTGIIIDGLADDRYFYGIQAVDNAYNGSYTICSGGVIPCFDLSREYVQVCRNDIITLEASGNAFWFSTRDGYLGQFKDFTFTATASDTIFSFIPQGVDCSKHKIWTIEVNDGSRSLKEVIYACEGKTIRLGIPPGWKNITWNLQPPVTGVDSVDYIVKGAEKITVEAGSGDCTYKKEFSIKLSIPELAVNGETFQIMKGGNVQLEATGTMSTFLWDPGISLSDNTIANPVATPTETTEYTLTATDSVGCSLTKRVVVQVEQTAFVPNLFTPNGDGKNDLLLIYGLTQANTFQFQIFNREGSMVYETRDVREATNSGWNGFVGGTRQPSGVYYWKVNGKYDTGKRVLLNGKETGSILLVH